MNDNDNNNALEKIDYLSPEIIEFINELLNDNDNNNASEKSEYLSPEIIE